MEDLGWASCPPQAGAEDLPGPALDQEPGAAKAPASMELIMSHREKDERRHTNKKPELLFMIKVLKKKMKSSRTGQHGGPTLDLLIWEGTGELRPGG